MEGNSDDIRNLNIVPLKSTLFGKDNKSTRALPNAIAFGAIPAKESGRYGRISSTQGRAVTDLLLESHLIWGGEFPSDLYGARDHKGVSSSEIFVEDTDLGLRVHGLCDGVGVRHIMQVSHFLRKNGLPTENPVEIRRLKEVVYQGKAVPVEQWKDAEKERLTKRFEMGHPGWTEDEIKRAAPKDKEWFDGAIKYLEQASFYVIERDLQTSVRLRDLIYCQSSEEFYGLIKPFFKWLSVLKESKRSILPGIRLPEKIDLSPEAIQNYFCMYLPWQIGTYLGRMHRLRIHHGFPHDQNWSLAGTLYDLDSVDGRALNGQPTTEIQYSEDVGTTVLAVSNLINALSYKKNELFAAVLPEADRIRNKHLALGRLVAAYIIACYGNNLDLTEIRRIVRDGYLEEIFIKDQVGEDDLKYYFPREAWTIVEQILTNG